MAAASTARAKRSPMRVARAQLVGALRRPCRARLAGRIARALELARPPPRPTPRAAAASPRRGTAAPTSSRRRGRPARRRRCARGAPRRPAACRRSCATRGRRASRGAPASSGSLAAASSNSMRTQPISPVGHALARCRRVACAISCAPRQMPSTGTPRACASAMTSRSRSSGASPSVPSGLTIAAEHDQAVEGALRRLGLREASRSRCARRAPRSAARARRAACRARAGSRARWDSRSRRAFSPIGAAAAPSREGTRRCVRACCWRWGSSTSSGDRPTSRSASASRRCSRSSRAACASCSPGLLTLAVLAALGRLGSLPSRARDPRRRARRQSGS